jgi:carboxylesterase type B
VTLIVANCKLFFKGQFPHFKSLPNWGTEGGYDLDSGDNLDAPLINLAVEAGPSSSQKEDCLTISVHQPLGTKAGDKLPDLFYIYGGGFATGATIIFGASTLLAFAKEHDQKSIYVAVNYRVGGYGFISGAEILAEDSANAGLLDQ